MSELPKGWVTCTPSDLANDPKNEIVDGPFGSNLKASEYTDEGTPIVRIQNVKRMAFLNKNIKYVTDEKAEFLKRHSFKSGDLLITKLGEPLGLTCIAPEHPAEGIIVADIVRLRPNPEVNRKCLAYLLNSEGVIKQINAHTKGSTRARINLSVVRNLNINLPPLAEQKRIVEKLDEVLAQVDTIKARLDGIPDLLKRFRQSVLASAVSGKLTEEWRSKNVTDALIDLENQYQREKLYLERKEKSELTKIYKEKAKLRVGLGNSIDGIEPPKGWVVVPFFEACLLNRGFDLPTAKRIEGEFPILSAGGLIGFHNEFKVEGPVITVGRSGSVGQVFMTDDDAWPLNTALYAKDIGFSVPKYIYLWLKSSDLGRFASSTAVPTLNRNEFILEPTILPPKEEQKEIVRLVDQYIAFADTIEAQVKKAQARVDNLTQSILAKAFRGELVDQDPNDEPADKLLERIAEARKEAEALAKAAKKAEAVKKRAAKKAAENF